MKLARPRPQVGDLVRYRPLHYSSRSQDLAVVVHVERNDVRLLWVKGRGKLSKFEWLSRGNIEVVSRA